jgi:hypothetical protein
MQIGSSPPPFLYISLKFIPSLSLLFFYVERDWIYERDREGEIYVKKMEGDDPSSSLCYLNIYI